MDSFELNKIMGAILGTCLVLLVTNFAAQAIFAPQKPEKPGFEIAVKEDASGGAEATKAAEVPIEQLLANASVEKGQAASKKCAACHTFDKGGPNKVGPNLWGIVGNHHAHAEGFSYSSAMQAKSGEPWNYEALNHFISSPRTYVPGTKMTFAGVSKASERADIIAYLRTLSDNPVPLPQ